jgi:hypothetical protein
MTPARPPHRRTRQQPSTEQLPLIVSVPQVSNRTLRPVLLRDDGDTAGDGHPHFTVEHRQRRPRQRDHEIGQRGHGQRRTDRGTRGLQSDNRRVVLGGIRHDPPDHCKLAKVAQPRNPDQTNDNRGPASAPADQKQQGNLASAPNRQSRWRAGAGRAARNVVVRGVRRDPPDIRKLARVVASVAADMVAAESGEQPTPAEPDTASANHRERHRDAA